MTELTEEKARIGAPSAASDVRRIAGMNEEGEQLSEINPASSPLAGEATKSHSHGGGVGIPDSSRAGRLTSYNVSDFPAITGREEDWRFTPLKRLRGLDRVALDGAAPQITVEKSEFDSSTFGYGMLFALFMLCK
jgi:Fe-S cluster assembly protein SufD